MNDLEPWREQLPVQTELPPQVQKQLWTLLARQAALYTASDSTSLPIETAQELFDSVIFLLRLGGVGPDAWASTQDLAQVFRTGQQIVREQIARGKQLLEAVSQTLPPLENRSLQDTIAEIGQFWRRYDYRFFAHRIPCQIDYQLSSPVDENLVGIEYINRYLEHLWIEDDCLNRLEQGEMSSVLRAYCPDYRGLLINLYEPVMTNCIGRVMLGCDVSTLSVSTEQSSALCRQLEQLPRAELEARLVSAARQVAEQLKIVGKESISYLVQLAKELTPRVMVIRDSGNLDGIFLAACR
ncbi:MAG: DUF6179 domain-containing protein [Lawsonibacter sp.]|nr:DUF6179 domain-containing protein [Lawsonibacter sp.]